MAMSRGREENRLYVVIGDGCDREDVGGAVERPYEVDQLIRSLERSRAKSLPSGATDEICDLDTASLKQEQQRIYERLSEGPSDRTREVAHLREEPKGFKPRWSESGEWLPAPRSSSARWAQWQSSAQVGRRAASEPCQGRRQSGRPVVKQAPRNGRRGEEAHRGAE